MDSFKGKVVDAIARELSPGLKKDEIGFLLEKPPKSELGDYAFPCFKLASVFKKSPVEIAKELSSKIKKPASIEKIEAVGPYINFFVKRESLAESIVAEILAQKGAFGKCESSKVKRVMVEYSAPNTNKPLHLGHLRNDSIGMALGNLLKATGHKAIKANLLNDRGIHICKTMLAYKKFGRNKKPDKKPDHFVGDFYVLFNEKAKKNPGLEGEAKLMLRKWENKDKETRELWNKMNSWVEEGFNETYKAFGSRFDVLFKESDFYDRARPVIEAGKKKGVFRANNDGALMAVLEPFGLPNKTIMRGDGTSIYITSDLALTKHKFEKYKLDNAVWVVGSEQNLYFQQLFKIFELLGFPWAGSCRHLSYGMVYLPQGRMKSREGTVIDADDIIAEVSKLAEKELRKRYKKLESAEIEKRAKAIALAAIKFYMLKTDSSKDLHFKPKESISFEGETGPYLQYTHARAKSIMRKAGKQSGKPKLSLLSANEEKKLVSALAGFPKLVQKSAESLEPHLVCHGLLDIASAFNSFYHSLPVLEAESVDLKKARLALVQATAQVVKNGLKLLNIKALEKM